MKKLSLSSLLLASVYLWVQSISPTTCSCTPRKGCSVALGNYIVSSGDSVPSIALTFQASEASIKEYSNLTDINSIVPGQALSIPFPCVSCTDDRLRHIVRYTLASGDSIDSVVHTKFNNLSQAQWVISANGNINPTSLQPGSVLNIPINCSCGDPGVSLTYGLFRTYVVQGGDNFTYLSQKYGVGAELLSKYNQDIADVNTLVAYEDIIFVPAKDGNGEYVPYTASGTGGANKFTIIGGSVGGAIILLVLVAVRLVRWKMARRRMENWTRSQEIPFLPVRLSNIADKNVPDSSDGAFKFSHKQLEEITKDISLLKQIGRGGFGTVYYAEINKQRLAIKKMEMDQSKEFMAEVQVLARVHHKNIVKLVGWCEQNGLFLVYEFVENGTLKKHLDAPKKGGTPLTWDSRLQIAIDTARGLEYIHKYAEPSYMHRDIKPDNILLDNNLHAKVADFGLARLGDVTKTEKSTGTRAYMAPELKKDHALSPKVDVFAFGIVLMQLVSGEGPIIARNETEEVSLRILFEEFMQDSNPIQNMSSIVDPTLKDIVLQDENTRDSIWKVIQLARKCTDRDPTERPDMRKVVIELSTFVISNSR